MHQNLSEPACNGIGFWKWDVDSFTNTSSQLKYAVLVLNRPISQNLAFIKKLWNSASVRVTVDGGTRRWDTYISRLSEEVQQTLKLPDLITGDFDSITEAILEKYKKKGCKAVHTPNQNHTDFTKALVELESHCQEHKIQLDYVTAICQSSGRLDQVLGNIQTLHLAKSKNLLPPTTRLYLITDDAVSWLLTPGIHEIVVPDETLEYNNAWCSLVPVGEMCESVTTSGLKWNLDESPLQFGNMVSTSNTFDGSEKVVVKCSHTILWSMQVPSWRGP